MNLYLAFSELGAEALEQANFLVIELNRLFPVGFHETQQTVMFREQIVMLPYATHTACADIDALQGELLRDPVSRFR